MVWIRQALCHPQRNGTPLISVTLHSLFSAPLGENSREISSTLSLSCFLPLRIACFIPPASEEIPPLRSTSPPPYTRHMPPKSPLSLSQFEEFLVSLATETRHPRPRPCPPRPLGPPQDLLQTLRPSPLPAPFINTPSGRLLSIASSSPRPPISPTFTILVLLFFSAVPTSLPFSPPPSIRDRTSPPMNPRPLPTNLPFPRLTYFFSRPPSSNTPTLVPLRLSQTYSPFPRTHHLQCLVLYLPLPFISTACIKY